MADLRINGMRQVTAGALQNASPKSPETFGKLIKDAISKASASEQNAEKSLMDLLQGKADVFEAMIAMQKADISMRMLVSVRNKALEAYREIMRMNF